MLYYHLHPSLPGGLFTSGFPIKILCATLFSCVRAIDADETLLLTLNLPTTIIVAQPFNP